ncbi:MAG: LytTR family DNA-binding domain-containing protein [Bacteroidota bacterium]
MSINAIIIDDEPLARDVIKTYLTHESDVMIMAECGNGNDALTAIQEHQPDLIFLDIQMPDLDGFGVLKGLDKTKIPQIIFTTAYDQYALSAFEVSAIDYLLKPFDQDRFKDALEKARKYLNMAQQENLNQNLNKLVQAYETSRQKSEKSKLPVKEKDKVIFIDTHAIDWIEASGDYICIHYQGRKALHSDSMNGIMNKLDPLEFLRIHRSTIVNRNKIASMEPYFNGEYHLELTNGTKLKSGRSYKEAVKALLT